MLLHLQQQNAINSKTIIAFIAILGNAFYTFTYFIIWLTRCVTSRRPGVVARYKDNSFSEALKPKGKECTEQLTVSIEHLTHNKLPLEGLYSVKSYRIWWGLKVLKWTSGVR